MKLRAPATQRPPRRASTSSDVVAPSSPARGRRSRGSGRGGPTCGRRCPGRSARRRPSARGSRASPVSARMSTPGLRVARAPCGSPCACARRGRRGSRRSWRSRGSASGTAGWCGRAGRPPRPRRAPRPVQKVTCRLETLRLLGERQRALQQGGAALGLEARAGQEAPAGGRGERHGGLELRVVAAAGALLGVRPVVVEDVLALAVALGVERHDGDSSAAGAGDQVARHPAGAAADGAASPPAPSGSGGW